MGRCSSCNDPFAFEPTAIELNTKLTDPFFEKVITDLSANNTLFLTPKQFYYLLDKRWRARLSKTDLMTNPVGTIVSGVFLLGFLTILIHIIFGMPLDRIIPILVAGVFTMGIWTTAVNAISPYLNRRIRQRSITTLKVLAGLVLLIGMPIGIVTRSPIVIIYSIFLGIRLFDERLMKVENWLLLKEEIC